MTTSKNSLPLDKRAFCILALGALCALGGLLARHFIAQANDTGPVAVTEDATGRLWVATKLLFVVDDPMRPGTAQVSLRALGVTDVASDLIAFDRGVLLLTRAGVFHRCAAPNGAIACVPVTFPVSPLDGKLAISGDGRWLAISDNGRDAFHLIDLSGGNIIAGTQRALNRPNGASFAGNELLLADTGRHRVISWLRDAATQRFDITAAPRERVRTQGQPYYFAMAADGRSVTVLESGSVLKNGTLRRYGQDHPAQAFTLHGETNSTLSDASAMFAQIDGGVVVAGLEDFRLAAFDINSQLVSASTDRVNAHLQSLVAARARGERWSWAALCFVALGLLAPIGLLTALGYALNQPIGAQAKAAATKPAAIAPQVQPSSQTGVGRVIELNAARWQQQRHSRMIFLSGALALVVAIVVLTHDVRFGLFALPALGALLASLLAQAPFTRLIFLTRDLIIERAAGNLIVQLDRVHCRMQGTRIAEIYTPMASFDLAGQRAQPCFDEAALSALVHQFVPVQNRHVSAMAARRAGVNSRNLSAWIGWTLFVLALLALALHSIREYWSTL